ncbi:HlyD family type I secretion periplasmic adaptor subunit [Ruegeria atlantica]|uniref:HlyD family type I secretion periplasmic adaptor subunit n=1 Tax=Ruegeria atlantica TaxID=81569 RepID=UPI00147AABBF|nr:HlyD family type I secretion periplasmic adaptor subunit [Ruegeria atlantica]
MTQVSDPMRMTSPTLHITILATVTFFVAILVMSFVFRIEVVARGQGRVVPLTRVQVVQPEFPGRITAIYVRNGMSVKEGQTLLEFDTIDAFAELGTIRAELERLRIENARLEAMVGVLENEAYSDDQVAGLFQVPPTLSDHPYAGEQRLLLKAELGDLRASFARIDAREEASRRSEAVTRAGINRIDAALDIQGQRLAAATQLLRQGTISRSAFLDVLQTHTELDREREVQVGELEKKIAERAVLASERNSLTTQMQRSLLARKAEIDARLAVLIENERAALRHVSATSLKAPVTGIVDQLKVFTVGGIAQDGAELMRIVPDDARIELIGRFSNQDVGFMRVGQKANIRFDAYPSERYGFVEATVSVIAADSTENKDGEWGYVVRLTPERLFLLSGGQKLHLRPGMTATIDVITDRRRIIGYFFAPIVRTIQNAMGER